MVMAVQSVIPVFGAAWGLRRFEATDTAVKGGVSMASIVALNVNGQAVSVTVDDLAMPLLYVLRENLELRGPRFGCGLAISLLPGAHGWTGIGNAASCGHP